MGEQRVSSTSPAGPGHGPSHPPTTPGPIPPVARSISVSWAALAICLAPLAAAGLLFVVTGIRPRPLFLLALQAPPFVLIALVESLWPTQNLPRTVARVLAPAALLLIGTMLIASSGSSTAALAFFALPYYTSAIALAGYGLVALLDRALRPLARGARWAVIWIVALAVGASPPVYFVVQDYRQAREWRRGIEQSTLMDCAIPTRPSSGPRGWTSGSSRPRLHHDDGEVPGPHRASGGGGGGETWRR